MSKVLLIIPHDRFDDREFETIFNTLKEDGHEVSVGSSHHTEAQGHYGLLVKPDINLYFVEVRDYDALIFIGGRGIDEYLANNKVAALVRGFYEKGKYIGALGRGVEVLIYAGIIAGKKVTCDISTIPKVQGSGGYYNGKLVQEDGCLITGTGEGASLEFAKTFNGVLKWRNPRGELYARVARS